MTAKIALATGIMLIAAATAQAATESIDFVTEHLAEVALNNGLATLPVWQRGWKDERSWRGYFSGGYNEISAQSMKVRGYMVAAALEHPLSSNWAIRGLLFADDASSSGSPGTRALNPIFLNPLPAGLPAEAAFGNLDGHIRQYGTGVTATWRNHSGWMDGSEWMGGVVWQRLSLQHTMTTYTLLEGVGAGTSGTIDYDANYDYLTYIVGMQWHRRYAEWLFAPHWHLTLPRPRGAVAGHMTGPGFDLAGDSATAGNRYHMGDGYLTLGFAITYLPAHLTFDVGTVISQYLLEPVVDEGIDRDLVLSMEINF